MPGRAADTCFLSLRFTLELKSIVAWATQNDCRRQRAGADQYVILRWRQDTCTGWHYIAPGMPIKNAFSENFNGSFRDAMLKKNALITSNRNAEVDHCTECGLQPTMAPVIASHFLTQKFEMKSRLGNKAVLGLKTIDSLSKKSWTKVGFQVNVC